MMCSKKNVKYLRCEKSYLVAIKNCRYYKCVGNKYTLVRTIYQRSLKEFDKTSVRIKTSFSTRKFPDYLNGALFSIYHD